MKNEKTEKCDGCGKINCLGGCASIRKFTKKLIIRRPYIWPYSY